MVDPFDALRLAPGRTEPSPAFRRRVLAAARAELDTAVGADERDIARSDTPSATAPTAAIADTPAAPVAGLEPAPPPRPRRPRRAQALYAALAAAALIAVAVAVTTIDDRRPDHLDVTDRPSTDSSVVSSTSADTSRPATEPTASTSSTSSTSSTATSEPVRDGLPPIEPLEALGGSSSPLPPTTAIFGGGGTLVAGRGNVVEALDPDTGTVRSRGELPVEWDVGVALSGGALWAASSGTGPAVNGLPGTLYRLDPATGAVVATIEVAGGLRHFSGVLPDETGAGVWMLTLGAPTRLVHVSAETNTVDAELIAPARTAALGVSPGSLWAARAGGGVSRLDADDGVEIAAVDTPLTEPLGVHVRGDQVWVFGYDDNQRPVLAKIDAATNTLVASVRVGGPIDLLRGYGLAVADGSVWVATEEAQLVQVDEETAQVVARYGRATGGGGVVATDEALWLATASTNTLYRVARR